MTTARRSRASAFAIGDVTSAAAVRTLMGGILLVLWPAEVLRLLLPVPYLAEASAALFVVYLLGALCVGGLGNAVLAVALAASSVALAAVEGWGLLLEGVEAAVVFAAFLPTIHLLRNVALRDPGLLAYRTSFRGLAPHRRIGWLLVSAHVLGSVLTVGALAVLSPVLPPAASAETRRRAATALVYGVSLAILWSPFFVGMAVVSDFMSQVPLWQPVLLGLAMAASGLVLGLALIGGGGGVRLMVEAVGALRHMLPLIAVAAAAVMVLRTYTSLSTLEAACLVLPPICLGLLALRPPFARRRALHATRRSLERLGPEISIVALAFILGVVMRASPLGDAIVGQLLAWHLPAWALIGLIVGGMCLAAAAGLHPMVAASVMLAVFAGTDAGLADLVLMGAVLLGWTCGAMIAVAGLIMIVASSMFAVPRRSLIFGANLRAVLSMAVVGSGLLAGLNAVLV